MSSLEESIVRDLARFAEKASAQPALTFDHLSACWEDLGLQYLQSATRTTCHQAEVSAMLPALPKECVRRESLLG